mmetsp:Transcript_395/g.572  ORF Transcript_395/g.572 Transcript_395/m.572 type:complete len:87 (+) Transcript_395:78-338(+)
MKSALGMEIEDEAIGATRPWLPMDGRKLLMRSGTNTDSRRVMIAISSSTTTNATIIPSDGRVLARSMNVGGWGDDKSFQPKHLKLN